PVREYPHPCHATVAAAPTPLVAALLWRLPVPGKRRQRAGHEQPDHAPQTGRGWHFLPEGAGYGAPQTGAGIFSAWGELGDRGVAAVGLRGFLRLCQGLPPLDGLVAQGLSGTGAGPEATGCACLLAGGTAVRSHRLPGISNGSRHGHRLPARQWPDLTEQ